jgi:hypothetical protein
MQIGDFLSLIGGSTGGSAIVFFILWMCGLIHTKAAMDEKKEEIAELKETIRLERVRGDSAVLTGQIVRDVMTTLHREIEHLCGASVNGGDQGT